MTITVQVMEETFPVRGVFRISRGARTETRVVTASVDDGAKVGRGECVPYAHYGETIDSVVGQIRSANTALAKGSTREDLQAIMPPGAARNAIDCALWD